MRLLPSVAKERVQQAIEEFEKTGNLIICEPCDCGSHIRHNNGGNYHDIIHLTRDSGRVFVKFDTTCELVAPAEWEDCENPEQIIQDHADWL